MERPVMIYDGDCGFCRRWIARWQRRTGDRVEYVMSQTVSVGVRFPAIPRDLFDRTVVLVGDEGRFFTGAEAVVRSLACVPGRGGLLWLYQHLPGSAWLMEAAYRFVVRHRRGWT